MADAALSVLLAVRGPGWAGSEAGREGAWEEEREDDGLPAGGRRGRVAVADVGDTNSFISSQAAAEGRLAREGNSKNVSPPDNGRTQEPALAGSSGPFTGGATKSSTAGNKGPPFARETKPSSGGTTIKREQPTIWQTARQQLVS